VLAGSRAGNGDGGLAVVIRPVVFLDVDGVLNGDRFFADREPVVGGELWTEDDLDPSCIRVLNDLIQRSGACIVVSSSWRHHHSIDELRALFQRKGLIADIIDVTPRMAGEPRGVEIATWLAAYDTSQFVVLDDEVPSGGLAAHWVRTDATTGLVPADMNRAIGILTKSVAN
jgi:hypothetical protein